MAKLPKGPSKCAICGRKVAMRYQVKGRKTCGRH